MTPARLLGVGLVAAVTGAALIAPPSAQAAPVFSFSELDFSRSYSLDDGTCNDSSPAQPSPPDVPLAENVPLASNLAVTATYTNAGNPADKITSSASMSATSALRSAGGLPQAAEMSFTGTVQASATIGTSACEVEVNTLVQAEFDLTLTQPMWVTMAVAGDGPVSTSAYLERVGDDATAGVSGHGLDIDETSTILVPAGEYLGEVEGEVRSTTNSTGGRPVSGRASITFAPLGSATAAPSGKAGKYVALPGARNCTAHTATATLTTKKKLIKQIDKVTYTVNGTKAATLKGKKVKKGRTVALVLADNAPATIEATVLLDNGKKRTVTATYRPCAS